MPSDPLRAQSNIVWLDAHAEKLNRRPGLPPRREYVAVDALEAAIDAAGHALCILPARHPDGLASGDTDEDHAGIMAAAAIRAAIAEARTHGR